MTQVVLTAAPEAAITEAAVMPPARALLAVSIALVFAVGCASKPPAPDWQANAKAATERAVAAYLAGNARVDAAELDRARREVGRTGRADLLARVELTHCAAQVASLVFGPCAGFEPLRADAAAPERAYADYLLAKFAPASTVTAVTTAKPEDAALLPEAHRGVAPSAIADPFARLIAAGVLLEAGRADPSVIALAVDTASAQGWRRPLLAWLGVQSRLAAQAGATDEVARLQRRIALVGIGLGP